MENLELDYVTNGYKNKNVITNKDDCNIEIVYIFREINRNIFGDPLEHYEITASNYSYHGKNIFSKWDQIEYIDLNKISHETRCVCGQCLSKEVFLIKRGNIKCNIGNTCIKRMSGILQTKVNEYVKNASRKTFDCEYCLKKRIKKDSNHFQCIDCKIDLRFPNFCKFNNRCYNCNMSNRLKNNNICRDCRLPLAKKPFVVCYNCKFN